MPFDDAKYHRDRRRAAAKKGRCKACGQRIRPKRKSG